MQNSRGSLIPILIYIERKVTYIVMASLCHVWVGECSPILAVFILFLSCPIIDFDFDVAWKITQ